MATTAYRENHYVAQWYQRRFLPVVGEKKFCYLDLEPDQFRDSNGVLRQKKALNRWGTDRCFKETDLYTTRFGAWESTEIEQFFFGRVDTKGRDAIEYFATFAHPGVSMYLQTASSLAAQLSRVYGHLFSETVRIDEYRFKKEQTLLKRFAQKHEAHGQLALS